MNKIGFELSFIDPKIPINTDLNGYFIYNTIAEGIMGETRDRIRKVFDNIHMDGGNFEVNSPIFVDNFSAIEYYGNVTAKMKRLGLITHSKKTDGGGLHFHTDVQNIPIHKRISLCQNMIRLPYLNWIFNNPIDTWNANNPYLTFIGEFKDANFHDLDHISVNILRGSKNNPIRFDTDNKDTIEYRFFDMPYNKKEFELLLNFIMKFHDKIIRDEYTKGQVEDIKFVEDIRILPINYMIDKFKILLYELNLKYNDYKIFVDRNMRKRYKYGTDYLV